MSNTTWQPGDRIRCVDAGQSSLDDQKVYIVDFRDGLGVLLKERPHAWYDAARFRKVEETAREIPSEFP